MCAVDVLLVEDDPSIASSLSDSLRAAGYGVTHVGTGRAAIDELEAQSRAWAAGGAMPAPAAYAHQIAFNVLPQIGGLKPQIPGYTSEEVKMLNETRKILGDDTIVCSSTCVRVPVFNAHSEVLNVEFHKPITPEEARAILEKSEGVQIVDDTANAKYPMPIHCSGKDDVYVGRIRVDPSCKNGLALFCCGDNIRKGAALNAVQIAEKMIAMGLK